MQRKGIYNLHSHCWCKYKLVKPLWKIIRRFLKILKIELHTI